MGGGALVGLESRISTVVAGWLAGAAKTNRSVMSRRRASPGNFRLSALKWFDILFFLLGSCVGRAVRAGGSVAQEVEQGGADLGSVGPGDGVRAALDHD